ncbi:unnamed protein product [Symbiodinium pilosum]|uniref:Uncharacterized protein n=1 Tax=Symbiodinium pilosum TaxID=2952 RepID=A0A812VK40_SYMPI|nr:unnamed protein product [Symbiodinium pilosum]
MIPAAGSAPKARRRYSSWSQPLPAAVELGDAGEGKISSSSSSSCASDSEEEDLIPVHKVHSLPPEKSGNGGYADLEMRKVRSLSSKQPLRQSQLRSILEESAQIDKDQHGYLATNTLKTSAADKVPRRGMPLERADRRRSQTFKSITVPDEVLQVLDSSSPDHEEEYGDSERPTGPVRRRSGALRPTLTVAIHTDSIAASIEADEEAQRFLEPGFGAPAPKHPMDRNPEMEAQRAAAIEKVAFAARKVTQKLEKQQQAMLARRRKRYQSAPAAQLLSQARVAVEEASSEPLEHNSVAGGVPAVVIFDWDDTLFPTRHVTEVVKAVHSKEGPLPPESPFYAELKAHAQVVESTLLAAREVVGRVSIVTLARRPWVETSASWYLPGVDFEKLMQDLEIEVFYAREHITRPHIYNAQLEEGVDMFVIAKRNAMLKCLRKIYGLKAKTMHVICVGDSTVEHLAIKEVLWCCPQEAGSFCKTIKLMSDPSVQNLTEELQVLSSWLQQIVTCAKDFDISPQPQTCACLQRTVRPFRRVSGLAVF